MTAASTSDARKRRTPAPGPVEIVARALGGHLPQSVGAGRWPRCFSHHGPIDWTPDHAADVAVAALRAEGLL